MPTPPIPLHQLLSSLAGGAIAARDRAIPSGGEITGITTDTRRVRPGNLFVAIPGTRLDGHDFLADAVARGAAAVVVERDVPRGLPVPVIRAPSSRRAYAELAAAWHGHPARALRLVGITGTLGKTSTLAMLGAILETAGRPAGTIGSLGVSVGGRVVDTGYTVPDPMVLQEALARFVRDGAELAAMEVTSHALDQDRVHGLSYELGIFTNLVPMEHAEYHRSFREYVSVKRRFLDLLEPGAPLVYSWDDPVLRGVARARGAIAIGCGERAGATVGVEPVALGADGTRVTLDVREAVPNVYGGSVQPQRIDLPLRLLGRSNVTDAALAAVAALCLGASVDAATHALREFPPARRRMEVIHRDGFTVLDDTVGHPDSVTALFEVLQKLQFRRLHVAFAIRGSRGEWINHLLAESLAIWAENVPPATLVVTSSAESADPRNRVAAAERDAFVAALEQASVPFEERSRLDDAVRLVLDRAGSGDVVLLLGAQGMDDGASIMHDVLGRRSTSSGAIEHARP
jgi:UDP-N-acetylmuramoyl-L-alanyl-D-glutamate--2,6-diaminopimelate ligase